MIFVRFLRNTLLILTFPAMAFALEEPLFDVVAQFPGFDVRRYAPYITAEVDVTGDLDDAGSEAFDILAGYIFGENESSDTMSMTVPVESRSAQAGVKMAMTAPVTTSSAADDIHTFAFVMERKYSLQTLPRPVDDRIRIRQVPERLVAVRRYSGRWTESNYRQNWEALRAALQEHSIQTTGSPTLARYNTPFSLPFLRRNEVMIEIIGDFSEGTLE